MDNLPSLPFLEKSYFFFLLPHTTHLHVYPTKSKNVSNFYDSKKTTSFNLQPLTSIALLCFTVHAIAQNNSLRQKCEF